MSRLAQYAEQARDGYGYEDFEPIPKGTEVVCFIEEAKWEKFLNTRVTPAEFDEFIKIRLKVVPGADYENRVMFHKLYILGKVDQTPERNDTTEENALMMLAAYDQICLGGALAKLPNDPEDEDLAKLVNKRVLVTVGINTYKNQFKETVRQNTPRFIAPVVREGDRPAGRSGDRPSRRGAADSGDTGGRAERPARRSR